MSTGRRKSEAFTDKENTRNVYGKRKVQLV